MPLTKTAAEKVAVALLRAGTNARILHWEANGPGSEARHETLGELYKFLDDVVDAFVEKIQGKLGQLLYVRGQLLATPEAAAPAHGVELITDINAMLAEACREFSDAPEIVNLLQGYQADLFSPRYRLAFLQ